MPGTNLALHLSNTAEEVDYLRVLQGSRMLARGFACRRSVASIHKDHHLLQPTATRACKCCLTVTWLRVPAHSENSLLFGSQSHHRICMSYVQRRQQRGS